MDHQELADRILRERLPALSVWLRQELCRLHSASAALATLQQRETDPQVDRSAAALDKSFYRLLRLSSNLGDMELLEESPPLFFQNLDLVELFGDLCRLAEEPTEQLGLELHFVCQLRSHIAAVDRQLMERLLWNLLSNAMAATPAGGLIAVTLRVERGAILLSVADNGRGFSPEQLDQMPPAPDAGTGLGLPLCRRIAQLHGGTLLLSSREGEGCTVTVRLPDRKVDQQLQEPRFDYAGGFSQVLLELADVLPESSFGHRYAD